MMKKVKATYSKDSKNYHMFALDHRKRIVGRIYVLMGETIPDVLKIYLKTDGGLEREKVQPTKGAGAKRRTLKTNN